MGWKKVINADAGDADHFGGNDLDKVSDLFSGVAAVDTVDMNSDFTFRDQRFKVRNPANTQTLTFANPPITASLNRTFPILMGDYRYTITKIGSVYYVMKNDGTIFTTGSAIDTVLQATIDQCETENGGSIHVVGNGPSDPLVLTTGFTGMTIGTGSLDRMYDIEIHCDLDAWFKIPNDFAGTFLTFLEGAIHCGWYGGRLYQSSGTTAWVAFEMTSASDGDGSEGGIMFNTIERVFIKNADIAIKLSNTGATGYVNGNYFHDILTENCDMGILFNQQTAFTSGVNSFNRNLFHNVIIEHANRTDALYGVKDVIGRDNLFIHCKVWDILNTASYHSCTITADAEYTIIEGGIMTYVGWPADNLSPTTEANDMWTARRLGKGQIYAKVAKTANYTATKADHIITVDGTSSAFTITLPTAVDPFGGREFIIKRTDILASSNLIAIDGAGTETIDGALTHYLWPAEYVVLQSDGANWQIVNRSSPGPYSYYAIKGSAADRRIMAGNQGGWSATVTFITSTTSPAANTLWALPLIIYKTTKCDLISFRDTTSSTAGNSRLGLYRDSGNCYPGALIFDSGAIVTTGAAGLKNSTITAGLQTLQAGLYWLTYEQDTATGQIISLGTNSAIFGIFESTSFNAPIYGYSVAHTFGALPDPYTTGATALNSAPTVGAPVPALGLRPI